MIIHTDYHLYTVSGNFQVKAKIILTLPFSLITIISQGYFIYYFLSNFPMPFLHESSDCHIRMANVFFFASNVSITTLANCFRQCSLCYLCTARRRLPKMWLKRCLQKNFCYSAAAVKDLSQLYNRWSSNHDTKASLWNVITCTRKMFSCNSCMISFTSITQDW